MMALECICFPLNDQKLAIKQNTQQKSTNQQQYCKDKKPKADLDLCKIVKRTRENEENKHSEYECHLKGERRQNLINKIKMYLDDYDDRPVMKRAGKEDQHTAKGQTGYGPMIKYPGYVDYNHPYFSDPYDKMPTLATTVGQRMGENPCPPISVRNYDETYGVGDAAVGGHGVQDHGGVARGGGHGCHCAKRTGEYPKCPAASEKQNQQNPRQRMNEQQWDREEMVGQGGRPGGPPSAMVCLCTSVP